jgi:hypothetical protein
MSSILGTWEGQDKLEGLFLYVCVWIVTIGHEQELRCQLLQLIDTGHQFYVISFENEMLKQGHADIFMRNLCECTNIMRLIWRT